VETEAVQDKAVVSVAVEVASKEEALEEVLVNLLLQKARLLIFKVAERSFKRPINLLTIF